VNLQLGRPAGAAQALCPSKDKALVKMLYKRGEVEHSDARHVCDKCSCNNAAGKGTGHVGYGLCKRCEAGVTKEYAVRIAREHLDALQAHQPFIYREPDRWLEEVQLQGASASRRMSVDAEVDVARSLVQRLISSAKEKKRPPDKELLDRLTSIEVLLDHAELEEAQKHIRDIRTILTCDLTVNTGRGLEPMSDDRQMQRVTALVRAVGALGGLKQRISQSDSYSKDEVRRMFARFATISQGAITDPEPDRNAVFASWVEKMEQAGKDLEEKRSS